MSHTLTETPTFDTPITVPDGADPGSNRAADVAAIAQKLANRTRSLKAVTDNAARRDQVNTFTQTNQFTAPNTTVVGLTATGDINGALLIRGENVNANTKVQAGTDVVAGGNFTYGSLVATWRSVDISVGVGGAQMVFLGMGGLAPFQHYWGPSTPPGSTGGTVSVPLALPKGAVITSIKGMINQDAANDISMTVFKRTYNWTTGTVTNTALGSVVTAGGTGFKVLASSAGGETIDNLNNSYWAEFVFGLASSSMSLSSGVFGMRAEFNDPGPRNG